jgi:hypothetical protein
VRTVLRHHFTGKPYVKVYNDVARDIRLSFAARGVLVDMLSRPTDWEFSAERIAAGSPREGRKAVLRCMGELEACGYLHRFVDRDAAGRFRKVVVVSDQPVGDWTAVKPAGHNRSPLAERR